MAWTSPTTVVGGDLVTAALWNTGVRDNLNATAVGTASAAARYFVASAARTMAERVPSSNTVATSQTTASTTYVDLATVGPAVTVTTGTKAWVTVTAFMSNNTAGSGCRTSWAMSGSNTVAANDVNSICIESPNANDGYRFSYTTMHDPITAGSTTWTAKYRAIANTGTFSDRVIAVIPF